MKRIPVCVVSLLVSLSALADNHTSAEAEVRAAEQAFSSAYAENRVDDYFDYYADDATVFFYGARQNVEAYYEEWKAMVAAGGRVEKNDISDLIVQVMPGGGVAVATSFIDYRARAPDGQVSEAKAFETDVWQKIDGAWKIVSLHYTEISPDP